MDRVNGHWIYRRPDGRLVKVTLVHGRRDFGERWDDLKYKGKVLGDGLVLSNVKIPWYAQIPVPKIEPPNPGLLRTELYMAAAINPIGRLIVATA